MIASIRGRVLAARLGSAVLECGGLGYEVQCTPSALARLTVGEEARLTTALIVREDSLTLYGFADDAEREVFASVQTVTGIGPRIALAVLAHLTPGALRAAVEAGDVAAIQKVPGIGRKGAQRMVLELAGKLAATAGPGAGVPTGNPVRDQVAAALTGLGWAAEQAGQAVDSVLADAGAPADVPGVLRAALRSLGGGGRG
ncbi:MAG: Holliday junction branch migration protein RuvA [Bifidobacteriaceae bacterium]|nr:Holliday junction branch migration protein RuvA [Bifidobacteriaceae bacterium]